MKKILILIIAVLYQFTAYSQTPFYGTRYFISSDKQDTLTLSFVDHKATWTFNKKVVDINGGLELDSIKLSGVWYKSISGSGLGSVTSVSLTVPTGLTVTGSPVTSSGTIAIGLQSGYQIPTSTKLAEYQTASDYRITTVTGSATYNQSTHTLDVTGDSSGSSQTFQQVLITGSSLTQDNTISSGNYILSLTGKTKQDTILSTGISAENFNDSILFNGTSITAGYDANPRLQNAFPYLVGGMLHMTTYNLGVSGMWLQTAGTSPAGQSFYDQRTTLIKPKTANRKFLIITHGENDAHFHVTYGLDTITYKTQYSAIIDYAISQGWSTSNIIIVSPIWEDPSYTAQTYQDLYFKASRSVAAAKGLLFIDVFSKMQDISTYNYSSHPSNWGHQYIANVIARNLASINNVEFYKQGMAFNATAEFKKLKIRTTDTASNQSYLAAIEPDGTFTKMSQFNFPRLTRKDAVSKTERQQGNLFGAGDITFNKITAEKALRVSSNTLTTPFTSGSGVELLSDTVNNIASLYVHKGSTVGNLLFTNSAKLGLANSFPASNNSKIYTDGGVQGLGFSAVGTATYPTGVAAGLFNLISGNVYIFGLSSGGARLPVTIEPYLLVNGTTNNGNQNLQVTGNGYISTKFNIGSTTASNARFNIAGGTYTSPHNSTLGWRIGSVAGRFSENSVSSGTVAHIAINSLPADTIQTTNTITVTNASTLYIQGAPVAAGNVTITNPYSLYVASGNALINGEAIVNKYRLSALNTAPSSATDTGTAGEIRITAGYIYVCTATNTWVRSALSTW